MKPIFTIIFMLLISICNGQAKRIDSTRVSFDKKGNRIESVYYSTRKRMPVRSHKPIAFIKPKK